MSKRGNPLLRKTTPARASEPEILEKDADIIPFNESFPGVPPMSVRDKKRLAELEAVVTTNFNAFYEVGCALREIHDSMLYRETHRTFAEYAQDLWDLARSHTYRLIDSANVVDRLLPYASES